jgi:hypothetical protein
MYVCANTPASSLFPFSSERIHDLKFSTPPSQLPARLNVTPCTNVYYQLIYVLYALTQLLRRLINAGDQLDATPPSYLFALQ